MLCTISCFLFQAKVETKNLDWILSLSKLVCFCQSRPYLLEPLGISLQVIFLSFTIPGIPFIPIPWLRFFNGARQKLEQDNAAKADSTNTEKTLHLQSKMCLNVSFRAVWERSTRWISPLETTVPSAEAGSHGKHPFSPPPTSSSSSCRSCTETLLCRTKTRPAAPTTKSDGSKKKTHKRKAEISLLLISVPAALVVCRLAFSN